MILTRPQKTIRAGNIVEEGRGLLFPLHSKSEIANQILEKFHDLYCGRDINYPINKILKEQLFFPNMKMKLTNFNKYCPKSCTQRALSQDNRYKIYTPGALGGTFQFSLTNELPLRTSCVLVDMAGPYEILCETRNCKKKVWVLLILNPATQFLELEILDDSSSASIVSGLIRYMSHHGNKNIICSDMGSNFWPLANRYATLPDTELDTLPPLWKRLLTKDMETLAHHGGYLWILFSTERHEAISRVEFMVGRVKKYLKTSGVFHLFKSAHFTRSEMATILASIVSTLNTRPLAIFQAEILTPQYFYFHNYSQNPNTDTISPLIRSTSESIENQIQEAVRDTHTEKIREFQAFKTQLGELASRLDLVYKQLATYLLPSLLKAYDSAGTCLNQSQFSGDDLQLHDVVFCEKTFEKTKNFRSSIFTVVYISKDRKSLLIARPKPQIMKKSKYLNYKVATPDRYYKKAHLNMEFMSRDIRSLNFICHEDNTDLVLFDQEWSPLKMNEFLDDILKDQSLSINITAPVITRRDNLEIQDTVALIERQIQEKAMKPEIEVKIPKQQTFAEFEEQPVDYQTKRGRKVQKPKRYGK